MKTLIVATILVCLSSIVCGDIGSATNPCIFNAIQRGRYRLKQGYDVRYGHGTYQGEAHMWCEYLKEDEWLVDRDTVPYVRGGYPVEDYKDYKIDWYGYVAQREVERCV